MLTSCALLMALCTVEPGEQGDPPHVQIPVGIATRVWRWLSSRSSSWFSCAVSRLRNPDDSCLLLLLHTLLLLYPVVALPLQAYCEACWTMPSSSPLRHTLAPKIAA